MEKNLKNKEIQMIKNGKPKNKDAFKMIQKAIVTGIGIAASKEAIKKAASNLYDDIQGVVRGLLSELEHKGEIKTKQTKKIIKELQKKSEIEKIKIYKELQKDSKNLLKLAKNIILSPVSIINKFSSKPTVQKAKAKTKKKKSKSSRLH